MLMSITKNQELTVSQIEDITEALAVDWRKAVGQLMSEQKKKEGMQAARLRSAVQPLSRGIAF
jgi:tagatose-1,6-bisphosphate aldolase